MNLSDIDGRSRHHQVRQLRDLLTKAREDRDQAYALIDDLLAIWDPEWEPGKSLRPRAIRMLARSQGES